MKSISLLYMSLSNDFEKNGESEMGRYLLKSMGALYYIMLRLRTIFSSQRKTSSVTK